MLDVFRTLPFLAKQIENAAPLREAMIFAAWRRIAGETLASHAAPIRLEDSKLSIAVSNLTWQRHLKDLSGQLLFKLNAVVGSPTVTFLEFEINEPAVIASRGIVRSNDETELRRMAEKELTPELTAAAMKIEDDDLRKQFLAAAGNCLVRRARKLTGD